MKKTEKHSNTWRLNILLLVSEWVNNEIKEEIKSYLEINENETTTTQNLWDTVKTVLKGKLEHYRPTSRCRENLK